jgi:hypothetical protein
MKRTMLVLLMILALGAFSNVKAQLFFDNFEYSTGRLTSLSGGNWISYSGDTLTNYIQVTAGNLGYSGYPYDSVGNKITIHAVTSSAEDAYREFAPQSPDCNIYVSFLLKITSSSMSPDTSTNGDYFMALLPSTSTTALVGRVSVKLGSTSSKYQIGIRTSSSNTTNWSATELDINSTYLVVLGYNIITGNTNDVAKLWVNPAVPGSEPAADVVQASALATDPSDIARVAIRQGYTSASHSQTPDADIDAILVGSTWGSVTGVTGAREAVSVASFNLMPCTPNPAVNNTRFSFSLSKPGKVDLSVFNVLGQKVATVYSGEMAAGAHTLNWTLKGQNNGQLSNGVYFYKLSDGSHNSTRRLVILK